jgi:hypothetical protein
VRRVEDNLIVGILINRTGPYDLLVDTGSQITTIDPALVSDLHLRIEGATAVSGVGTHSRIPFAYPSPREDGPLPTSAFEPVFISYSKNYTASDSWVR